jgi:hypothetical protein
MLALSKDRELRSQLAARGRIIARGVRFRAFSKQVELALFFDANLDVGAMA